MKFGLVEAKMIDADEEQQEIFTRRFQTLVSSIEGTFPMNRSVGISREILDSPVSVAMALLSVEIYRKAEEYMPEIDLEDIECNYDADMDAVSARLIYRASDVSEGDSFLEYETGEDEDYEQN